MCLRIYKHHIGGGLTEISGEYSSLRMEKVVVQEQEQEHSDNNKKKDHRRKIITVLCFDIIRSLSLYSRERERGQPFPNLFPTSCLWKGIGIS
mmetsp:Transcript_30833/g.43775  ORF Transcript_30833/g.43775 Transcript_30833/m.43775 type:complete len:93 (-) Transcript_30833:199-477(-)